MFGVRVALFQRKVAKDKTQLRSEPALHFLDNRIRASAMRALVVAIFDERHGRAGRALNVVTRANRHGQACDIVTTHDRPPGLSASRARRIPSAPGLTPTGER